jgi:hypothetical protein
LSIEAINRIPEIEKFHSHVAQTPSDQ